jgi:hypothetical protein
MFLIALLWFGRTEEQTIHPEVGPGSLLARKYLGISCGFSRSDLEYRPDVGLILDLCAGKHAG